MRPRSMAHKLEGTVLEILRTAQSIGCTVDDMHPPPDLVDKIPVGGELEIPVEYGKRTRTTENELAYCYWLLCPSNKSFVDIEL
ncbi:hypothetical protein PRIPAC_82464 [Pristionchus pacificus]|uniref:Uncharacterized protein n=1 Tax=Pristionchus pacificus TaxID=54126 RepID=A0A2A6CKV2_PRIPA|nr:hypothetical protein PRIPAC_82464 [Pristionchus pacificus]|eukprot:PDM78736.1 hypothetical protein PRIPAC_31315 [Pristionchus pacificus]